MIAIRAARRGAIAAAVIFGGLEIVATVVARPIAAPTPAEDLLAGVMLALLSLPGLALLGAGLTSAALGSRSSAASAGLAMGVGVPVAAVASAMIGAFVLAGIATRGAHGSDVAGILLRTGVTAAVRISPLIALASAAWVMLVRRLGPVGLAGDSEPGPLDPGSINPGGGPRP